MERLKNSLAEVIKAKDKLFLWVGVIENKKARKYKYELYWFSEEDYHEEDSIEDHYFNANSMLCETLKEAYAYGFEAVKDAVKLGGTIKIIDLTDE